MVQLLTVAGCILCGLLVVVVSVMLACYVNRRRHEGKYGVEEKERRHGASGANLYEEAQFGEYVRYC